MLFEKINDNKLKIIFSIDDLLREHIDIHFFMSNPIESQHLFLGILNKAKGIINYSPNNCFIKVENLFFSRGNFILIITKEYVNTDVNRSIHSTIYYFETFEDYCSFLEVLKNSFAKHHNCTLTIQSP